MDSAHTLYEPQGVVTPITVRISADNHFGVTIRHDIHGDRSRYTFQKSRKTGPLGVYAAEGGASLVARTSPATLRQHGKTVNLINTEPGSRDRVIRMTRAYQIDQMKSESAMNAALGGAVAADESASTDVELFVDRGFARV
jgi:hypothetical protein